MWPQVREFNVKTKKVTDSLDYVLCFDPKIRVSDNFLLTEVNYVVFKSKLTPQLSIIFHFIHFIHFTQFIHFQGPLDCSFHGSETS